jgi:hypothetical protein
LGALAVADRSIASIETGLSADAPVELRPRNAAKERAIE